ncbi:unnamed protein product [Coregonus sp. 'balchen']|nr:unnamed protein product [Coregonus sp. 'balchen']
MSFNNILNLSSSVFQDLKNLNYLNNFSVVAESVTHLPKLTQLGLCNNYLMSLQHSNHKDVSLRSNGILSLWKNTLSNCPPIRGLLDFSFNKLRKVSCLHFLKGQNQITNFRAEKSHLTSLMSCNRQNLSFPNLTDLNYRYNRTLKCLIYMVIRLGSPLNSPFVNLTKLCNLKLDLQMPHGLNVLPYAFFRGLSSLQSLNVMDNHIFCFAADTFDDLTNLTFLSLDNSYAGVMWLQAQCKEHGHPVLLNGGFRESDKAEDLASQPKLNALPKLSYLDVRNIPLSCTCLNSDLQNWTLTNQRVQLVLLYKYLFATTTTVILLLTIIPLLYNKLYWKLKYSYYVFRSWFGQHWHRLREKEEHCKYDAFIAYNSVDEPWVLDQLLPNLEGNGASFRVCLHHRDFELGRNIVDNIISSMYSSRKTICVVSRHFLHSDWCSLEIQLASYRLFHELWDVLLLIFLEPIPERKLLAYHRMRQVMLKKTYLQWPGVRLHRPGQSPGTVLESSEEGAEEREQQV